MGVSKKLQILGAARPTQARPTETRPIQAHPTQARPTHDRNHPQLISPDVCHDQDVGHNRHLETAQGEAEGSHGGCDQGVKYQLVSHTFEACGGWLGLIIGSRASLSKEREGVGLRTAAGFPSVQHSGHISVWRMTWVNHGIKSVIAKGTGKGLNGGWRRRGFLLLPGNMSAMVHLKRHCLKT